MHIIASIWCDSVPSIILDNNERIEVTTNFELKKILLSFLTHIKKQVLVMFSSYAPKVKCLPMANRGKSLSPIMKKMSIKNAKSVLDTAGRYYNKVSYKHWHCCCPFGLRILLLGRKRLSTYVSTDQPTLPYYRQLGLHRARRVNPATSSYLIYRSFDVCPVHPLAARTHARTHGTVRQPIGAEQQIFIRVTFDRSTVGRKVVAYPTLTARPDGFNIPS